MIPFLKKISQKFHLDKPVVVADSGLLSHTNIDALQQEGYQYTCTTYEVRSIIGARLKNESEEIRQLIIQQKYRDGDMYVIDKGENQKLIVQYSAKRAKKDFYNRKKG